MLHTTRTVRVAAAVGAGIVTTLFTVPAYAQLDPGPGPRVSGFDQPAPTSITDPRVREELNRIDAPPVGGSAPAPAQTPTTVLTDDGAMELTQIAVGALAGVAVGAAGMGLIRHRRHGMQPA